MLEDIEHIHPTPNIMMPMPTSNPVPPPWVEHVPVAPRRRNLVPLWIAVVAVIAAAAIAIAIWRLA
jgi:hypothetical protein